MYAVVSSGGKQYRVEAGSELVVERIPGDAGASITFDRVLLVGDGDAVTVGTPTVDGASVSGTVLGEAKGPKLIVFKFKQKVKYRRKNGHRQHLTRVRIDEISANGKRSSGADAKAVATPAEAAAAAPAKARRESKRTTAKAADAGPAAEETPKPARRRATKKADTEAEE
jgi:large subunit ribosomal protein L21